MLLKHFQLLILVISVGSSQLQSWPKQNIKKNETFKQSLSDLITSKMDLKPFTDPKCPACEDPNGQHEDNEYRAWTDGHQSFEDEPDIEVDAIERSDAERGSIGKDATLKEHYPTDQIEPEEHWKGEK